MQRLVSLNSSHAIPRVPLVVTQYRNARTNELDLKYEMMRESLKIRSTMMLVNEMKMLWIIPNQFYHTLCFSKKFIG